ncbi:MAG: hypothetical protein ACPGR8_17345, partial [Limisphaerales bacterium]
SLQQREHAWFEMFANYSMSQYQRDINSQHRPKKRFLNGAVLPRSSGGGSAAGGGAPDDVAFESEREARLLHYELRDHVHGNEYWKRKAAEIVMKYMLVSTEVETRLPGAPVNIAEHRKLLFNNVEAMVEEYQTKGELTNFSPTRAVDVSGTYIGHAYDRALRYIRNWAGWFTSEISADAHILSAGIRVQFENDRFCTLLGLRFSSANRKINCYSESAVVSAVMVPAGTASNTPNADQSFQVDATSAEANNEWIRSVRAYEYLDTQLTYRGLQAVFDTAIKLGLSSTVDPAPRPTGNLIGDLATDTVLVPQDGTPVSRIIPIKLVFDPLLPLLRHCGFNILEDTALVVPIMVNLRGHNAEFAQGRVVSATLMMIDHPQLLRGTSLYERCKSMVRSAWRLQTGYEEGVEQGRKFRRVMSGSGRVRDDAALQPAPECYNIVADAIMAQFHSLYPPGTSVDAPTRFRIVDAGTRRMQAIEALALCDKALYKTIDALLSPSDSQPFKDFCKEHSHTAKIDCGILRLRPVFPSKDEEMHHLETVSMIYNVPTYDMDESGRWYIGAELDDFMEGMMMYRKVRR